jgi:dipeptidyl aminopeptidase/acylaminoacyl peptidase
MGDTPSSPWSYERRLGYPFITEVAPAPDGRQVAYAVQEPILTDEKSELITNLYLASAGGGEPVQLTFGEHPATTPRWSPDGTHLAFLSKRSGKSNVHIMRVGGGEAWPLTKYNETDISTLCWAPDGRSIVFLMPEPPTEEKQKARKAKDDAIHWDQDFDFAHLFVVPFAVGPRTLPEPRQITRGRYTVVDFDWLPDGNSLAITHRPNPGADCWPATRLGIVPADGSADEPRDLGLVASFGGRPIVSPDGKSVACYTGDLPVRWASSGRVVIYPTDGGEARPLARTPDEQPSLIGWSGDGSRVYVEECIGATAQIYAVPTSGEAARALTSTQHLKSGSTANLGGHIAFIGQDIDQPNAVYLLDSRSGETGPIAQPALPAEWPNVPLATSEVIRWRAPDGREIEGILTYPLGHQSGQRCPLIVEVHGGPTGVFQRTFLGAPGYLVDAMDLAERGYALLCPNPRGSSGYGREFRFANHRDWGGGDFQDVMAGVDSLVSRGLADPDRLGIVGWSYGGYLTSWAITQTNRFKAAVVGAGVTNLVSFNGTSDIPSFIPDYFAAEFWDDLEIYRQRSAVFNAKGVTTPTLILHGEQDVRVPLGQGRELYNALKRQGVQVDMAIYPRQGHGIGEPRLRVDLQRRTTSWLDRWIRGVEL